MPRKDKKKQVSATLLHSSTKENKVEDNKKIGAKIQKL